MSKSRKYAVHSPTSYCPICGERLVDGHRCDEAVLARRDAQERREPGIRESRSESDRIDEGMRMIGAAEDDDEEDQ